MIEKPKQRESTLEKECYVAKYFVDELNKNVLANLGAELATILKNTGHPSEPWSDSLSEIISKEMNILKHCAKNTNPGFNKIEIMREALRMVR